MDLRLNIQQRIGYLQGEQERLAAEAERALLGLEARLDELRGLLAYVSEIGAVPPGLRVGRPTRPGTSEATGERPVRHRIREKQRRRKRSRRASRRSRE